MRAAGLEFWESLWSQGLPDFHLPRVNETLTRHWASTHRLLALDVDRRASILVPLCGATVDVPVLAQRGANVTGALIGSRSVSAQPRASCDVGVNR